MNCGVGIKGGIIRSNGQGLLQHRGLHWLQCKCHPRKNLPGKMGIFLGLRINSMKYLVICGHQGFGKFDQGSFQIFAAMLSDDGANMKVR